MTSTVADDELLPCFEHMSQYDPEGAKYWQSKLWDEFAEAAGCSIKQLKKYISRIRYDGFYGPVSDEDWEGAHDEACNMADAQAALGRAWDSVPVVKYTHPDYGYYDEEAENEDEDGTGNWVEDELTIPEDQILLSYFPGIHEIYGQYPRWQ